MLVTHGGKTAEQLLWFEAPQDAIVSEFICKATVPLFNHI